MTAKTIKSVLKRKISDWIESIEDPQVQAFAMHNTIVTGGAIASLLKGEKVNDYDIYFKKKEAALAVAQYYVSRFNRLNPDVTIKPVVLEDQDSGRIRIVVKSAGIVSEDGDGGYRFFEMLDPNGTDALEYVDAAMKVVNDSSDGEKDRQPYRPVFISSNAITLSDQIQIVIRFYGSPDEIHGNYDFAHCTNYYTFLDNHLELRKEALEALLTGQLVYIGSKYPLCSVIRTRKFIKKGFHINAGQYLKMLMQVHELNLSDISVLEDQLVGVDSAYFRELIQKLKEKDPERVDSTYLAQIVDQIF